MTPVAGDFLFAASITNVTLARLTINLFFRSPAYFYSHKSRASGRKIAAFLLLFALISLGLFSALTLSRTISSSCLAIVAGMALVVGGAVGCLGILSILPGPVEMWRGRAARALVIPRGKASLIFIRGAAGLLGAGISTLTSASRALKHPWGKAAFVLCAGAAGLFGIATTMLAFDTVRLGVVLASPLALIPVGAATLAMAQRRYQGAFAELPAAPPMVPPAGRGVRVVWIILDEFDQRLGFDERPDGVSLPHLDRLASESVVCKRAVPPSRCTEVSMPAFFTGRLVADTVTTGPNSLDVCFEDGSGGEPFAGQATIFDELRRRGFNCGVTTWYHPFPRIFGDRVVTSNWQEALTLENSVDGPLLGMTLNLGRGLLETIWYSPFGRSAVVSQAVERHRRSLAEGIRLASDERLDLALLHLPVPHSPFIREAMGGGGGPRGYLGNLMVADDAFGEIRLGMEAAGLWDRSVVILTSDHWWRQSKGFDGKLDIRVPFLVRFPGQVSSRLYDKPFNTIVIHSLICSLFEREIEDPETLLAWLASHGRDVHPTKV